MRFLYVGLFLHLENIRGSGLALDPSGTPSPREQHAAAGIGARSQGDIRMLDLILIALGLGFFGASIAYVYACDRL
jgi:hypothetical protein